MDEQRPTTAPSACLFCGRPVATGDACPRLASSHWACCACQAPGAAPAAGDADAA
jgi:hypothetical protein